MQTQLISAPESSAGTLITPLAYLDAYDAPNNDDYAFAAYKETDLASGAWRVRIKARHLTGVVFEPEAMRLSARAAGAHGKAFFTWGNCIDPTPDDQRSVQYRVHVADARPARIEIFVQLRQIDGSPAPAKSAVFDWPA